MNNPDYYFILIKEGCMKQFFAKTTGKVIIVTAVALLIFCIFVLKTTEENKADRIQQPQQAIEQWRQEGLPVFIDFTADWCPYCKEMEPAIEQFRQEYTGKINFVTVDVDDQPEIAAYFGAASVPFYLTMDSDGNPLLYLNGATTKEVMKEFIDQSLEKVS